jgi:glycosyltransferase involved in cell wall biosynthesis
VTVSVSSRDARPPVIGLGMPVYNGARYLEPTLDSILAQTFADFELVICDNASTDDTERICRRYAAADPRIRYHRNAENLGAHPNYNLTYDLSRGRFFKWTPYDDVLLPDYLASCVGALIETPEASVCQSHLAFIDGQGAHLGTCRADLFEAQSPDAAERFAAAVLRAHNSYDMQGVHRREILARSRRLASFHGSDRALVAELALLGPFLCVPRGLMQVRDHDSRYTRAYTDPVARAAWHDAQLAGRKSFPHWRLYRTYWELVSSHGVTSAHRLRCRLALLRWWFVNWNAARMAIDLLAAFVPGIVGAAERFKQRFSPAPGIDQLRKATRKT